MLSGNSWCQQLHSIKTPVFFVSISGRQALKISLCAKWIRQHLTCFPASTARNVRSKSQLFRSIRKVEPGIESEPSLDPRKTLVYRRSCFQDDVPASVHEQFRCSRLKGRWCINRDFPTFPEIRSKTEDSPPLGVIKMPSAEWCSPTFRSIMLIYAPTPFESNRQTCYPMVRMSYWFIGCQLSQSLNRHHQICDQSPRNSEIFHITHQFIHELVAIESAAK